MYVRKTKMWSRTEVKGKGLSFRLNEIKLSDEKSWPEKYRSGQVMASRSPDRHRTCYRIAIRFYFISFHFIPAVVCFCFCSFQLCLPLCFIQISKNRKRISVEYHYIIHTHAHAHAYIWQIRNANSAIFLKYIYPYIDARHYFVVYTHINIQSIRFDAMLLFYLINAFECKAFEPWMPANQIEICQAHQFYEWAHVKRTVHPSLKEYRFFRVSSRRHRHPLDVRSIWKMLWIAHQNYYNAKTCTLARTHMYVNWL